MPNAFKYNKISIVERCINKNIRYVGEYQLKCKQSTNEFDNLINVCQEVNFNLHIVHHLNLKHYSRRRAIVNGTKRHHTISHKANSSYGNYL